MPYATALYYVLIVFQRTRGYLISPEPLDMPLAPPSGNPSASIPALGCPCFSSSEPFYTETILIAALKPAAAYLQTVALTPGYENEIIIVTEHSEISVESQGSWEDVPEEQKPVIATVDKDVMTDQVTQLKRWRRYLQTGEAPDTDSDDDSD